MSKESPNQGDFLILIQANGKRLLERENRFKKYMNEQENGVEIEEVAESAPAQTTGVDYEALLAEKDAEIAKVRTEKENYRKGLLKAKGKMPEDRQEDDGEPEDQEAMTRRIVGEALLSTKEAQLQAERDAALTAVLRRNKELETALKNRGQINSASAEGSNQEKPEGKKDSYFSNDQIAALKAKGYDDKKIETLKKNMAKINQMPR